MKTLMLVLSLTVSLNLFAAVGGKGKGPRENKGKNAETHSALDLSGFKSIVKDKLSLKDFSTENLRADTIASKKIATNFDHLGRSIEETTMDPVKARIVADLVTGMETGFVVRNKISDLLEANPNHPSAQKAKELIDLIDNGANIVAAKVNETESPVNDGQMLLVQSTMNKAEIKSMDDVEALYNSIDKIVPVRDAKDCT